MLLILWKWFGYGSVCARFFGVFFVVVLVATAGQAQKRDLERADEGVTQRVALVIGNTNYDYKPLKNPRNDARDMAAALTKLRFKVTLKYDLPLSEMRDAANAWAESLDGHTLALVYYSGHGIANNGQNYFVPVNNAAIKTKRDVPYQAYPFQSLLDATKEAGCPLRIFILDACRNDPLPRSLRGDVAGENGLTKVSAPTGSFIAYAAGFGETASDNASGQNGLYTSALLKNILTPNLPIESLFKRVRGAVLQLSSGEQHPDESSQLVGEFCFSGAVISGGGGENPAPVVKTVTAADYIGQGNEYYGAGKYGLALASYTFAVGLDPASVEAHRSMGGAYHRLQQFDKAVESYGEALRLKSDDALSCNERGVAQFALKRYERALEDFSDALRLRPDYSLAYANRGDTYLRVGEIDKALADLTNAIRLNSGNAMAYQSRARAYYKLKQFDKALDDATEALRLRPDDYLIYSDRAWVYARLEQYDKAVADSGEAIRLRPDVSLNFSDRAAFYAKQKAYDRALEDFTTAIGLKPNDYAAYDDRGNVHSYLKQYDRAVSDYTEALRLNPDYAQGYESRAQTYEALGQPDKALADYQKRVQLSPPAADWITKRITELQNKRK